MLAREATLLRLVAMPKDSEEARRAGQIEPLTCYLRCHEREKQSQRMTMSKIMRRRIIRRWSMHWRHSSCAGLIPCS
eukprot:768812-Hanusia_phi.AAC.6